MEFLISMRHPEPEWIRIHLGFSATISQHAACTSGLNCVLLPANREDSLLSRSLFGAGGSALSPALFRSDLSTEVAGVVVGA